MKKTLVLSLLVALISAAIITSLSKKTTVHAQDNQRIVTQSLGITHGDYLVADLASFPDNATKLVLRDPNGRVGLILAVSNSAGAERAQIEFYGANGQLLRTVNASSAGSVVSASSSEGALEARVQRLEGLVLPVPHSQGQRSAQSNIENLWIKLDALDGRVKDLEQQVQAKR